MKRREFLKLLMASFGSIAGLKLVGKSTAEYFVLKNILLLQPQKFIKTELDYG